MDKNHIESLPEEILIEIFNYLSPKMVQTCCAVTKRWNTIIDNSKHLMDNFLLKLEDKEIREYQALPMRRNYQAIDLERAQVKLLDIINPNILKSLDLKYCELTLPELVHVLKNLPALEVLYLSSLQLEEGAENEDYEAAKLLKLEFLQISSMTNVITDKLLNKLDVTTIRQLAIDSYWNDDDDEKYKGWINFLKRQEELEQLHLGFWESTKFFDYEEIFEFKFELKYLELEGEQVKQIREFCFFLSTHSDTLETLLLGAFEYNPEMSQMYNFIWNNMRLKRMDANVLKFGDIDDIIDILVEYAYTYTPKFLLDSVRLYRDVYEDGFSKNYFKVFISSLARVKQLDIRDVHFHPEDKELSWKKVFEHMSYEMTNLEILLLPSEGFDVSILASESIYFPKLSELFMAVINDEEMCQFIQRHSRSLRKVSFKWSDEDFMDNLFDELFGCENLKLIHLLAERPTEALSIFKILYRRIKQDMTWHFGLYVRGFGTFNYKFPDDAAFWDHHFSIWKNKNAVKKEDFK
ncbi:hypothetical protein ACKWTF_003635 [Chironomus riparius]